MDDGDASTRLSHLLEVAAASSNAASQRERAAFSTGLANGGDDSADSSDGGSAHSRELNRPPVMLMPKRSYSSSEEEEEEEEIYEDEDGGSYESHPSVDEAEYDDGQQSDAKRGSDVPVEIFASADEDGVDDGEVGERDVQYTEGDGAIARERGGNAFDTLAGVMDYNSVASSGAAPAPRVGYTGLAVADIIYVPVNSQSQAATHPFTSAPTEFALADQATVASKGSPSGKSDTPRNKTSTSPPSSSKQKAKRKAKASGALPSVPVDEMEHSIASLKKVAEDVSVVCMHVWCICLVVASSRCR